MLTREIMGALALAILWVNTLLIAAAALKQAGSLWRRLSPMRPLIPGQKGRGLIEASIEEGSGDDGSLAHFELDQIGRAGTEQRGRRTIHFGDRTFTGVVHGGKVSSGGASLTLAAGDGEIWPERTEVVKASGCDDRARFDKVYEEARKARGHARKVRVDLRAGLRVFIVGEIREPGGAVALQTGTLEIGSANGLDLLVSAIDPRKWLRRRIALAVAFAIIETAIAAGITVLVLVPPIFDGWPSRIGGIVGLGFFLAVQPLGTAVRDALRPPSQAFVRGRWIEPSPGSRSAKAEEREDESKSAVTT